MPLIILPRSANHQHCNDARCKCCPYGYHIDRDFVPFTRQMLSREREGDCSFLQELKDKWRCERQSMDELLGVPRWSLTTTSKPNTDLWKSAQPIHNPDADVVIGSRTELDANYNLSLPFGNGLDEAVTDFEEALLRTRPAARVLSFDTPDSQKFHTFPRIRAPAPRDLEDAYLGNRNQVSKGSSATSSSTTSTVIMKESTSTTRRQEKIRGLTKIDKKIDVESIKNLESTYKNKRDDNERQQLSMSIRLQDLEEQVKLIPELEVKLNQLNEEKRQLLKLLDVQKQNQLNQQNKIFNNTIENNSSSILIRNNTRDILRNTKSEDSLSGDEPKAPPRRKTRDASVGRVLLTRDVGCSHTMPRTRSIGVGGSTEMSNVWDRVGGLDSSSPTGSLSGTLRRRVRSFETGVQVNNHDLMDESASVPILRITESKDVGIQALINDSSSTETSSKTSKAKLPLLKSIGIVAVPQTRDAGNTAKPYLRDSSCNTIEPEKYVRHQGITADIGGNSLQDEKTRKKPVKDASINTEKIDLNTIGINTTEALKKAEDTPTTTSISSGLYLRKSESPTRTDRKSVERISTYEEKENENLISTSTYSVLRGSKPAEVERKNSRESLTLPLQSSQVSRQTTSHTFTSTHTHTSDIKGLSRIPRLTSPLVSPVSSPKSVSKPIYIPSPTTAATTSFKNYSTLDDSGSSSSSSVSPTNAPVLPYKASTPPASNVLKKPGFYRSDTYTKEMHLQSERSTSNVLEPLEEEEREKPKPSTSYGFMALQENREKATPSKEMQGALKVLNDALLRGRTTQEVTSAISIILHEWFRIAGTKTAIPLDVEDYLDSFESYSPQLLRYIVNMPDGNGNTAMHYAVSHGNFDVVSILLDSKVCDPNKANKAGYTSVMLVSLAKVLSDTHRQVVRRLFGLGDVNIKAAQHGQTALMLGASHGRLDTVRLLLEAGADINIQDEDGSTALMCASEHGHGEIVKYLLAQPDCDPHIVDNDGSTALTVAMEAGHKDIGVMLYAHMHFVKAPSSPYGHVRRSRSTTPRSTPSSKSNSPITSAQTSPIASKKAHSSLFQ